ncbi:MAG: hypothetical protein LBD29_04165 [Treponema sp.]|jgi:hypothetical protein|nr:hypothetical protein [Treponema sp.]
MIFLSKSVYSEDWWNSLDYKTFESQQNTEIRFLYRVNPPKIAIGLPGNTIVDATDDPIRVFDVVQDYFKQQETFKKRDEIRNLIGIDIPLEHIEITKNEEGSIELTVSNQEAFEKVWESLLSVYTKIIPYVSADGEYYPGYALPNSDNFSASIVVYKELIAITKISSEDSYHQKYQRPEYNLLYGHIQGEAFSPSYIDTLEF